MSLTVYKVPVGLCAPTERPGWYCYDMKSDRKYGPFPAEWAANLATRLPPVLRDLWSISAT